MSYFLPPYSKLSILLIICAFCFNNYWNKIEAPVPKEKGQKALQQEVAKQIAIEAALLKNPEKLIGEICSPSDAYCYVIKDVVSKNDGKISAHRRLLVKRVVNNNALLIHSQCILSAPSKLTWNNLKTTGWPVQKTAVPVEYGQMMIASGFITEALSLQGGVNQRVLLIGLGGGTITNFYSDIHSVGPYKIEVTAVEIDPIFVRIAEKYFGHKNLPGKLNTVVEDGVVFLKKAVEKGQKYQQLLLDTAYSSDIERTGLLAPVKPFLEEKVIKNCYDVLFDGGVLAINILAIRDEFHHEKELLKAYSMIFPSCFFAAYMPRKNMLICVKRKKWTWKEEPERFNQNLDAVIDKFNLTYLKFLQNH